MPVGGPSRTPISALTTNGEFVQYQRYTYVDICLSMIYSSITPVVYMVNTRDSSPIQTPINFADSRSRAVDWTWEDRVAIWSCRFSADGNEIVAGGTGKIFGTHIGFLVESAYNSRASSI